MDPKTAGSLTGSVFQKNKNKFMKVLYLVRHAKSSWDHDLDDHERALNKRGTDDARLIAEYLKNKIAVPEKIFSSDAERAVSTARYFKEALNIEDADFEVKSELYDFNGQALMRVITNLDTDLNCVMIVGHNYAMTSVVNMLGDKHIENVPTTGFVMLKFKEKNWSDITTGITVKTIFPRDLKP